MDAFFDSYLAAFERLDAAAIAQHFGYPLHVVGDADEIVPMVAATEAEWLPQLDRLVGVYRRLQVSRARILSVATTALSPRLWHAAVHWELREGTGQVLYDFEGAYTLARMGGRTLIVAIAHNELPRVRDRLSRASS